MLMWFAIVYLALVVLALWVTVYKHDEITIGHAIGCVLILWVLAPFVIVEDLLKKYGDKPIWKRR